MKKTNLFAAIMLFALQTYAGGLLTNTNQSIQFVRMMSRNASTGIDAVYFNPAGLTSLEDGWHFALNSQTIFQTKPVESNFPLLNEGTYEGKVNAPVFPSGFAVYKMDRWAFSFGVGPNAGGGSAVYESGLPSFEIPISKLPGQINALGIPTTRYDADLYFKGSSVFWGLQLGAAYKLTDIVSASLGLRVMPSVNTYEGHIRNIRINPTHPALNPTGELIKAIDLFNAVNPAMAPMVADKEVDTRQSGVGYTPVAGLNITPVENFNIALKYELKTNLSLDNKPNPNDNYSTQIFGDGVQSDIPAILGVGAGYNAGLLEAQLSYTLYFNKEVDWGTNIRNDVQRDMDKNGFELGLGLQFNVLDNFAFSVGGMIGDQGFAESYQSDFSFSNPHVSAGAGIEWRLTDALKLDAGVSNSFYKDETMTFNDPHVGPYNEIYKKTTLNFGVGLSYSIFR